MQQAITGVTPSDLEEATIMTVWPSMAALPAGRFLGRLCGIRSGVGSILTVGNLIALASIPAAAGLFFFNLLAVGRRYRLTNRRVVVERGPRGKAERSVSLDDFDAIDVQVLPGQEWFPAGELIFRKGQVETFRLSGVLRPATFQQTCLKAQRAHAGVKRALAAAG